MPSDTGSPHSVAGSSVAVVGVGALGCLLAQMLVRGGAADVVLIDHDAVEKHNLGTQVLYDAESVEEPKALAAAKQLAKLGLPTRIRPEVTCFMERNAERLVGGVDHVFCAVDNLASRRIVNRACLRFGIPWTYGAAEGQRGEAMLFTPRASSCYECMLPAGIDIDLLECRGHGRILLPSLASVASWCLGLAFSREAEAPGRRYMFDLEGMSLSSFAVPRNPDCPVCGPSAAPHIVVSEDCVYNFCGNVTQIIPKHERQLNLSKIRTRPPVEVEEVKAQFAYLRMAGRDYVMRLWRDGRLYISPRLSKQDTEAVMKWWREQIGGRR